LQAKYSSVKFFLFVASLLFQVSVRASQVALTSLLMMSGPQFTQLHFTLLSGLEAMLESYYKLQQNGSQKQFLGLKMHFSWFGVHYWTCWPIDNSIERLPRATADVCRPVVDILNIFIHQILSVIFN